MRPATRADVFGLLRPALDAHALGITTVAQLLAECGFRVVMADAEVAQAAGRPEEAASVQVLTRWLRAHRITRLGFSYRLDPEQGARLFGRLLHELTRAGLLAESGGPLAALYFAGLPAACAQVAREQGDRVCTFQGDESTTDTLRALGVPPELWPAQAAQAARYDEARHSFARNLLRQGRHLQVLPVDRHDYPGWGTPADRLVSRLAHSASRRLPPLMRAHVGPYLPERTQALALMLDWTRQLAAAGLLDVLSIGTSQLSQSRFGESWEGLADGGGVPVASPAEFTAIREAAGPMLVRTYAGSRNPAALAAMYEHTLNMAWHALSLWWFCQLDGRGPYPVSMNLHQHLAAIRVIAHAGKPLEPNVPHHFAFRGADDVTYVVSGVLAARAARVAGIRHLVLQVMLGTPKATWGVQDLAKARALLTLVRELQGERFQVILQPRAGLDALSCDLEQAKVQLAAATALMDDIEPADHRSPPLIHVVSYSEGSHLANPAVINESIQITRAALVEYRRLRQRGEVEDMTANPEVWARTEKLVAGARAVLAEIDRAIPRPHTAEGLYQVLQAGFLPVPWLEHGRAELPAAVSWQTRLVDGGVQVVDRAGRPVDPAQRARESAERWLEQRSRLAISR